MMKKDLTNSQLDRQNILNNNMALEEIRNTSNIQGVWFEDKVYFTKNMVAEFFEVDIRTIERCVSANLPELEKNGYEIIKGTRLKGFIEAASSFNAAGHIDEEFLTELMTAILDNTYDNDEALKLKLFNAISVEEQFYE